MISRVINRLSKLRLTTPIQNNFAIKTSQQNIIVKPKPFDDIEYTREYFKLRSEDPDYERNQMKKKRSEKQEALKQQYFNNTTNDRNPNNFIKVNINNPLLLNPLVPKNVSTNEPFILRKQARIEKITVTGIRRNIPSKLKKLVRTMKLIRKRHVYDSIYELQKIKTKASLYILKALRQTLNHAKHRGWDSGLCGKQKRFKLIRYCAKMRHGTIKKDICQIRITLEYKPVKDMYQDMISGHSSPAFAHLIKKKLLDEDADYDKLRKQVEFKNKKPHIFQILNSTYQFILTAKGRQQRRLMIKRKVQAKLQQFRQKGVNVSFKVIREKIIAEEAELWAKEYEQERMQISTESINKRLKLFEQNEKITG